MRRNGSVLRIRHGTRRLTFRQSRCPEQQSWFKMNRFLSRRKFLARASCTLGVTALGVPLLPLPSGGEGRGEGVLQTSASVPKKRAIKKAIMFPTLGLKGTLLEKFKALKSAGFEGVEPMSHMDQ